MSNTVEFDLVRLSAQSANQDPRRVTGGVPEYTRADILACLAEVPHMSFHCLLAKYCGDELSEREVVRGAKRMSLEEWFTNPEHATKRIETGQLPRIAELAVMGWLNPNSPHGESNQTRASYMGVPFGTWRANFQSHYAWLLGELQYLERLGDSAYRQRKFGRRD